MGICLPQMLLANLSGTRLSLKQRFLKIQSRIHEPLGDGAAVNFREAFSLRQQPVQQIVGARKNDHIR